MKYVIIFVVIIIGLSLFFMRFNTLNENPKEDAAIEKNNLTKVEVKNKSGSIETSMDKTLTDVAPGTVEKSVEKKSEKSMNNENMNKLSVQEQHNNKFIFQTYDFMANAQAFIAHLKRKEVSFPVKAEKNLGRIEVFFLFSDKKDKQNKLKTITKITGITFNEGG